MSTRHADFTPKVLLHGQAAPSSALEPYPETVVVGPQIGRSAR